MAIRDETRALYAKTRAAILAAALPHIAFDGWSAQALTRAQADSGLAPDEIALALPSGARDLAQLFVEAGDAAMLAELPAPPPDDMPIRARITRAVQARLIADAPHKEAVRRLVGFYAAPHRQLAASALLFQTADIIWHWAGDRATDYNYYTKRAILSGVLTATRLVWLGDAEDGFEASFAFLDRRINNVMQFEKLKAKARISGDNIADFLPDPLDILARLRYG